MTTRCTYRVTLERDGAVYATETVDGDEFGPGLQAVMAFTEQQRPRVGDVLRAERVA